MKVRKGRKLITGGKIKGVKIKIKEEMKEWEKRKMTNYNIFFYSSITDNKLLFLSIISTLPPLIPQYLDQLETH